MELNPSVPADIVTGADLAAVTARVDAIDTEIGTDPTSPEVAPLPDATATVDGSPRLAFRWVPPRTIRCEGNCAPRRNRSYDL
jgi:hypothetical protein